MARNTVGKKSGEQWVEVTEFHEEKNIQTQQSRQQSNVLNVLVLNNTSTCNFIYQYSGVKFG